MAIVVQMCMNLSSGQEGVRKYGHGRVGPGNQ